MEDFFEIQSPNLIATPETGVFGGILGYMHFPATIAECVSGKKMNSLASRFLTFLLLFRQNGIALIPQLFRDNGLHFRKDPIIFGLEHPFLVIPLTPGVIGSLKPLDRRVFQQPVHGGVGKLSSIASSITSFIE